MLDTNQWPQLNQGCEHTACIDLVNAYHMRALAKAEAGRGRSSGVERNLAKVEVVSSNLIARSTLTNVCRG